MQTFDIVSKKKTNHLPSINPFDDVTLWYDFHYNSKTGDDTTKLSRDRLDQF